MEKMLQMKPNYLIVQTYLFLLKSKHIDFMVTCPQVGMYQTAA